MTYVVAIYHIVPSAIWKIFSEFVIFCNLFRDILGEWNNSKNWETSKIFANIARGNVEQLLYLEMAFPCSPVIRECLWNKSQIEKKNFRDQNFIDWNTVNLEPPWFPPVRLTYSHKNKLISFYRIKIFDLMRSHQTSRTSQILHFRTKYEVVFHPKRAIWEKLNKKMSAEDEVLIIGYLPMRKRRNHQQQK